MPRRIHWGWRLPLSEAPCRRLRVAKVISVAGLSDKEARIPCLLYDCPDHQAVFLSSHPPSMQKARETSRGVPIELIRETMFAESVQSGGNSRIRVSASDEETPPCRE